MNFNKAQLRSFIGLCKNWPGVSMGIDFNHNAAGEPIFTHPDGRRWRMDRKGRVTAL